MVLLVVSSQLCFAQAAFDFIVWSDDFDAVNQNWKQVNNTDEMYLIGSGNYVVWRKVKESPAIVLPEKFEALQDSKIETEFVLDAKVTGSSAGLVLVAGENPTGAIVIEINSLQEFRVNILKDATLMPLSAARMNAGWEKNQIINKAGKANNIKAFQQERILTVYINDKKVFEHELAVGLKGKCGLYIGSDSKATFAFLKAFVTAKEAEKLQMAQENDQSMVEGLTQIISKLRATINAQNRTLDSLENQISKLESAAKKNERLPQQALLSTKEINTLKENLLVQEKTIKKLEKEVEELRQFKTTIKSGDSGDLIISLSTLLSEEKARQAALKEENARLKQRLKELEIRED